MNGFRRWHLALVLLPVLGWLLLLAYWLDETRPPAAPDPEIPSEPDSTPPPVRSRLVAAMIDAVLVATMAALIPPTFAWIVGSLFLLFRDAGASPLSPGKRLLKLRAGRGDGNPLSYTESFSRNLPLLVPYVGAASELLLVAVGRQRLGDRLAGTRVRASRP